MPGVLQFLLLPQKTPIVSLKKERFFFCFFFPWLKPVRIDLLATKRTLINSLTSRIFYPTDSCPPLSEEKECGKKTKFVLCSSKGPIGGSYMKLDFISVWEEISIGAA